MKYLKVPFYRTTMVTAPVKFWYNNQSTSLRNSIVHKPKETNLEMKYLDL